MNSNVEKLAGSWFIWGLSYYLYYPFISLFAIKFTKDVTSVYLFSTLLAIPIPFLGGKLSEKIGLVKSMELGCIISGIGLILLSFSTNLLWLIFSYFVSLLFFLGLPSYYAYMNNLGKGVISEVWAISIIPSLFIPAIGGTIATYLGLRSVFLIAGILMILAFVPLLNLKEIEIVKTRSVEIKKLIIPVLVIFPISLVFPYVYLVLKENYLMPYDEIGVLATMAEVIGAIFTFLYSKLNKRFLLSLYLLAFSFLYLVFVFPYFSLLFGFWEAIIPSALEESEGKSPRDFGIINSLQQVGWLIGYLTSYVAFSISYSFLFSTVISITLAIYFLIKSK